MVCEDRTPEGRFQPRDAPERTAAPDEIAAAGLVISLVSRRRGNGRRAFRASAVFLYGMLGSAAIGLYPYVLQARNEVYGLSAADAASAPYGLGVALAWWIPGMVIACGYFIFLYRTLPATVSVSDATDH